MSTNHDMRRKVLDELVRTERDYVNMLFKLTENVTEPIRASLFPEQGGGGTAGKSSKGVSKFISADDFDTIFQGCTLVLEANKNFFPQIAQKLTDWSETQTVGDVFVEWSHYFKLYKFYCNHFDTATHVFSDVVNKSKKFAQFIDDAMPRMNFQTVQSIMISPIQRIPRYLLLLKELVKYTGPEHPDSNLLAKALKAMSGTAAALDDSLSVQESALELFCVITKFRPIPELEQPAPGLVLAAPVEEHTSTVRAMTLVLLRNGSLLLGGHTSSHAGGSFSEKDRRYYAYLGRHKVVRAMAGLPATGESIVGAKKWQEYRDPAVENRRFTVYARPRSFIFTAPSRADAEMWVEKLQSTVAANRATSTSASRRGSPRKHDSQSSPQNEEVIGPIWEEDCASGGKCRVCERSFNVGVRRHHCRCCGLVACDKCTSGRMHILRLGYVAANGFHKGQRVCKKCEATVVLDNDLAGKRVVSLGDASAGVRTKATSLSPTTSDMARQGSSSADLFPKFWLAALGDDDDGNGLEDLDTPTVAKRRFVKAKRSDISLFDTPSTTPTASASPRKGAGRASPPTAAMSRAPSSTQGISSRQVFTPGERATIPGLPTPDAAEVRKKAMPQEPTQRIPRGAYSLQASAWSDDSD